MNDAVQLLFWNFWQQFDESNEIFLTLHHHLILWLVIQADDELFDLSVCYFPGFYGII